MSQQPKDGLLNFVNDGTLGERVLLSDLPWWTAADQAELDHLARELVALGEQHQRECFNCSPSMGCEKWRRLVGQGIEACLEFRNRRELASRAQFLRSLDEPVPHRPALRVVA